MPVSEIWGRSEDRTRGGTFGVARLGLTIRVLKVLRSLARTARPVVPVARALRRASDALATTIVSAQITDLEAAAARQWAPLPWNQVSPLADDHPRPLVSVIMPTWNRGARIARAIESVVAQTYDHWELLIADDGSTDGTAEVVASFQATDSRIRYLPDRHRGHAAARNRALAHSTGDVFTYLDTDNTWYPHFLAQVVDGFAQHPDVTCLYLAQLVVNWTVARAHIRCEAFDPRQMGQENLIDLNVFAHRRAMLIRHGGFDEKLTRLVDWDLIRRYVDEAPPLRVPVLGARYEQNARDSVTATTGLYRNDYLVRRKWERPIARPLRVLYALWHYPQLSETYVRFEIAYMRRMGVQVEVWSELETCPAPFAVEIPVHHGELADALACVKPDVVHVHWSNRAESYAEVVAAAGLALTVRDHGFDYTPGLVNELARHRAVHRIYLFPHLAKRLSPTPKVRPMPVAFSGDLYPPCDRKDPRLVLRVGAALRTKDLEAFCEAARRCPEHRFVLAAVRCVGEDAYLEELTAYNESLGRPVDLRINVPTEEVAALMAQAGIYLHTHGLVTPYGMPISIAEAMATGCVVIGRRCPASEDYLADAGRLYDTVDEAVAWIHATTSWCEDDWRRARHRAVDHAYRHFVDLRVLPPMMEDWQAVAAAHLGATAAERG